MLIDGFDSVRSAIDALGEVTAVAALNHYDADDPVHRANRDWLVTHDHMDVVTNTDALVDRWA